MADNQQQTQVTSQVGTSTQRVVTIITTRGERTKIPFDGTTWKELKNLLTKHGKDVDGKGYSPYQLDNMKAVESIKKTTLEHPEAIVPDGNFGLYLMPYQSKSGGEARDKVKSLASKYKTAVKSHFGNWTIAKEEDLAAKLKTFKEPSEEESASPAKKGSSKKTTASKKDSGKTKPAAKKATKGKVKETSDDLHEAETVSAKVSQPSDINTVLESARTLSPADQMSVANTLINENKQVNNGDDDLSLDSMRELSRGFKDVKRF